MEIYHCDKNHSFYLFNEVGQFTSDASRSSQVHELAVKVGMSTTNTYGYALTSPLCIKCANSKE